jgi:hypothetical protein
MANARKRHSVEFKTKVAVEAIRQQKTTNEFRSYALTGGLEYAGPNIDI